MSNIRTNIVKEAYEVDFLEDIHRVDTLSQNVSNANPIEIHNHNPITPDSINLDIADSIIEQSITIDTISTNRSDLATIQEQRYDGVPLPFNLEKTDFVFVLILGCLLIFTYIGGLNLLKDNLKSIFSLGTKNKRRDTISKEIIATFFLALQPIILLSIGFYNELVEYFPGKIGENYPLTTIAIFILVICIFFSVKFILYKLLGYIFDIPQDTKKIVNIQVVLLEVYGILFFLPVLLLIYSNYWHLQIAVFIVILLIIGQLMLFYRIVIYFISKKFNFLFLIAYLCSLEIIPYLFLIGTLVFLYNTDVLQIIWL